jgi:hypothetical protein
VLCVQKSVLFEIFGFFLHKLVKLVLIVICEVAFIFIDKVRSHFPTFIHVDYNN